MSTLKRLIRREVGTQKETIVGTVLTETHITDFDGVGGGVFVVDVEVGANNYLRNVPVKANRNRFYAQIGQTVLLRRNAQGRYEVTAPGDRVASPVTEKSYDLGDGSEQSSNDLGFTSERVDLPFYETLDGISPSGVLWADGVTAFNLVRIVDALGNPV